MQKYAIEIEGKTSGFWCDANRIGPPLDQAKCFFML